MIRPRVAPVPTVRAAGPVADSLRRRHTRALRSVGYWTEAGDHGEAAWCLHEAAECRRGLVALYAVERSYGRLLR
jgi:hypothetical protein